MAIINSVLDSSGGSWNFPSLSFTVLASLHLGYVHKCEKRGISKKLGFRSAGIEQLDMSQIWPGHYVLDPLENIIPCS